MKDEMYRSYTRVLPRDLFNEAKLLKCYGRLSLLIEDGFVPYGLAVSSTGHPFTVYQRDSDGGLTITNVSVTMLDRRLSLYLPYNSREDWPLLCELDSRLIGSGEATEIEVFNSDGSLTKEFLRYVRLLADDYVSSGGRIND